MVGGGAGAGLGEMGAQLGEVGGRGVGRGLGGPAKLGLVERGLGVGGGGAGDIGGVLHLGAQLLDALGGGGDLRAERGELGGGLAGDGLGGGLAGLLARDLGVERAAVGGLERGADVVAHAVDLLGQGGAEAGLLGEAALAAGVLAEDGDDDDEGGGEDPEDGEGGLEAVARIEPEAQDPDDDQGVRGDQEPLLLQELFELFHGAWGERRSGPQDAADARGDKPHSAPGPLSGGARRTRPCGGPWRASGRRRAGRPRRRP